MYLESQRDQFRNGFFNFGLWNPHTAHALGARVPFTSMRKVEAQMSVANVGICLVEFIEFPDLYHISRLTIEHICAERLSATTLTNKTISKFCFLISQYCLVKLKKQ